MAFGDSLTRGYYNKGQNHHPYTGRLQSLLNRLDNKRCFIVENQGKDGDVAFGEMPKRMDNILRVSGINIIVYSKYYCSQWFRLTFKKANELGAFLPK